MIKTKDLGKAVQAAEELGMEEIPDSWVEFMKDGWKIVETSCTCGGHWAWLKPIPFSVGSSGEMCGCVCCTALDVNKLMSHKEGESSYITGILIKARPTKEDVGKIFYSYPGMYEGEIISREDFLKLDPDKVGYWTEISELDVWDVDELNADEEDKSDAK